MGPASSHAARTLYEAIAEERLAEALELVDPGVVIEEHPPLADASPLHGHAGLVRLLRLYADAFGTSRLAVEEIAGAGETVLVRLRLEREDGAVRRGPVTLFHVDSFTGGRATRIRVFSERSSALAAAGLAG